MSYSVKEIYYTLQGEGAQSGRAAVFCRFSGCNLWSGLERDRAQAICRFCDTDFVGTDGQNGGKFKTAEALATAIAAQWVHAAYDAAYVVFTGGEPCLQLDAPLIDALHDIGFEIGIETNGTLPVPADVDWICVSPKPYVTFVQETGNELKFIYPQEDLSPDDFATLDFEHFYLQPMDVADEAERLHNVRAAIAYCLENPHWTLSLQTHKIIGID